MIFPTSSLLLIHVGDHELTIHVLIMICKAIHLRGKNVHYTPEEVALLGTLKKWWWKSLEVMWKSDTESQGHWTRPWTCNQRNRGQQTVHTVIVFLQYMRKAGAGILCPASCLQSKNDNQGSEKIHEKDYMIGNRGFYSSSHEHKSD